MFGMQSAEISPVAPANLATLSNVKTLGDITVSTHDTVLNLLIAAASLAIEAYCGTILAQRTVTETIISEDGLDSLVLRYAPVISLTSYTLDGAAQLIGDYEVLLRQGIMRRTDGGALIGARQKGVIVYAAGYATIPSDVAQATRQLVLSMFYNRQRNMSLKSEDVPDVGSVEYASASDSLVTGPGGGQLPADIAILLARYVRRYS